MRFYLGASLVKMQARVAPEKRLTDVGDFPSHKAAYAFRDVDGVRRVAQSKGEHVGPFVYDRLLLGGA